MTWKYGEVNGVTLRVSDTGEAQAVNKHGDWVTLKVKVGNHYGQWRESYPYVYIPRGKDKNRGRMVRLCALVAYIYHGPCPHGYVVTHKDGDVLNCTPSNVAYTRTYSRHVYGGKGIGYKVPVIQKISPEGEVLAEYDTIFDAAVDCYVSESFIADRCSNRPMKRSPFAYAGFSFRYKEV